MGFSAWKCKLDTQPSNPELIVVVWIQEALKGPSSFLPTGACCGASLGNDAARLRLNQNKFQTHEEEKVLGHGTVG